MAVKAVLLKNGAHRFFKKAGIHRHTREQRLAESDDQEEAGHVKG
jgi:hypothetical protein